MKVEKLAKLAQKYLQKEWGKLDFKYQFANNNTRIDISGDLTLTKCGTELSVLMEMSFCTNGLVMFDVTFDKLDVTFENLQLVNALNQETPFFKAYITDNGYLRLARYLDIYTEKEVPECLDNFFSFILSDSLEEDIQNIVPLLHD